MTKILDFSDGFTSTSPPVTVSTDQENFTILNNQTNILLFDIDALDFKSAELFFTLSRADVGNVYIQTGSAFLNYDGTNWAITFGNFTGSDMIQNSISNPFEVVIYVTNLVGVGSIKYSSGNMGASYTGSMAINITRIAQ
jgi:hypothetical protein